MTKIKSNKSQLQLGTEQTSPANVVVEKNEVTPYSLVEMALSKPDFDIEKLQRLLDMQKDYEDRKARKEFFEALAKFQYECPTIEKNSGADFGAKGGGGNVKYNFATLDQIVKQIKEPLKNCGLTYRYDIKDLGTSTEVTCVITHINGHSESTTMNAGSDTSGAKNAIQAKGSTMTYLQRYTLIGALGITTADADDDGGKHPNELADDVLHSILVCTDRVSLADVWDANANLHKNKTFLSEMKKRKEALGVK